MLSSRFLPLAIVLVCAAACGKRGTEGTTPSAPAPAQAEAQDQAQAMAQQHVHDAPAPSAAIDEPPAQPVEGGAVAYGEAGGHTLQGYFTRPTQAEGALPGVIVFHEWWGLNDNIRRMADRLAAQGYAVLAADLYDGKTAETPDAAQPLMRAALAQPKVMDQNIEAAYAWLKDSAKAGRVATLGWCFGGGVSFEAAQVLGARASATVIYYGQIDDKSAALARIKAPVLALFGGQDSSIPAATIAAFTKGLEAQGARPIVRTYPDAGHAFANPSGKSYRKDDAEDAWRRTLDFLGENLQAG